MEAIAAYLSRLTLAVLGGALSLPSLAQVDIEKHYALGVDALKTGYYDIAITQFETVLLYHPQHRGALIDLAIAWCASGDVQACDTSREDLATRLVDVPQVSTLIKAIEPKRWHHMTQLDVGYSNNLNKGLSDKQLNMSVQGVPVILTLQDASVRQSGVYQDLSHYSTWQSTSLYPRWEAWGYAYVRQTELAQKNQLNLTSLGVKRRLQTQDKTQHYALGAGFTHLSYNDTYQFSAPSVLLDWQLLTLPWSPKLEFILEARELHAQSTQARVETWAINLYPLTQLQIRFEATNETSSKQGYIDNLRHALQVMWMYPLSSGLHLSVLAQTLLSEDAAPYAPPLIDSARVYSQNRLRLTLGGRLAERTNWQCSLSQGWQNANHPLFTWQEQSVQCGASVVY